MTFVNVNIMNILKVLLRLVFVYKTSNKSPIEMSKVIANTIWQKYQCQELRFG
jgi:hypothetical protein